MNDAALSPSRLFPSLRLGKFRFVLKPRGAISLPAYQGSTWRGVIGNALRDVVCPWDKKACEKCPNRDNCAYHYLYEAGLKEKSFANLPRPYIFSPTDKKVPELHVEMTLVGEAGRFLPHLIAAWNRAGERGAGKGRGNFILRKVYILLPNESMKTVYEDERLLDHGELTFPVAEYLKGKVPDPPWKIIIETPLRLRQDGRNMGSIDWENAFRSLAIRLSIMNQKYCGGTRPDKDVWQNLTSFLAAPGTTEARTRWFDWKRFSSTQDTHVPMGGLIGENVVTPSVGISTWWRWWEAARLFHLGKGTSMGLGKIALNDYQGA